MKRTKYEEETLGKYIMHELAKINNVYPICFYYCFFFLQEKNKYQNEESFLSLNLLS